MGSSLPIAFAALVLAACSTVGGHDGPGCKGPRRPANPHGSVLAAPTEGIGQSPAPAATGGCAERRP